MSISIPTEDQPAINQLRIDLAQVGMDVAMIQTNHGDSYSRHLKEKTIEALRSIKNRMDQMGIQHSATRRCADAEG